MFEFLSSIKARRTQLRFLNQLSESDQFNQAIREIAYNLVNGKISLTNQQKKTLRPFGRIIVQLANASNLKKRKVCVQKGRGLITLLIPAALAVLNELIN